MNIKWDIYKLLTEEEKEEFNYKFSYQHHFYIFKTILNLSYKTILFLGILILLLLVGNISLGVLENDTIIQLFLAIANLLLYIYYSLIIGFIADMIIVFILWSKQNKFIHSILYIEIVDGKEIYKRKDEKE